MPDSKHLFFPNLNLFQEMTGRPLGVGMIKYAASWSDHAVSLDLDDKTIRKLIKGERVTRKTLNKFTHFLSRRVGTDNPLEELAPDRDMLINHAIWHVHFGAISLTEGEEQCTFLKVGRHLLDCEILLANQLQKLPTNNIKNLYIVFNSPYGKYLLADTAQTTSTPLESHINQPAEELVQNESALRETMISGMISLQMCLLAAREIDLQRYLLSDGPKESWLARFLPQLDSEDELIQPLRTLFEHWKEIYQIQSWEKLATSMPTLFGTSINNRTRKLYSWMDGSYTPDEDIDGTAQWIQALQHEGIEDRHRDCEIQLYSYIYVCNFQRILQVLSVYGGVQQNALIAAFSSYQRHFQSILDDELPITD